MALYLVSYDIPKKDAIDYSPLWEKLLEMGGIRVLYSEWLIVDEVKMAGPIYGELTQRLAEEDRLLVIEVTNVAAWENLLVVDDKFKQLLAHARG